MSNNFNQLQQQFQSANSIPKSQLIVPDCFPSNQSNTYFEHHNEILKALSQARFSTLNLFNDAETHSIFADQIDPEFSPIGWHLGHIAYTEALWILAKFAGSNKLRKKYEIFFANGDIHSNPICSAQKNGNLSTKSQRTNLPDLTEIFDYAKSVRSEVLEYLEYCNYSNQLNNQVRTWYWLIQHEIQHSETIAFLRHLNLYQKQPRQNKSIAVDADPKLKISSQSAMIDIPAAEFWQGSDRIFAQDNERPRHLVKLERFAIDQNLVTVKQYQEFIANGGYSRREWWTEAGWQWLQSNRVNHPLYWQPQQQQSPVYGVSWYEANAYAVAVGKRLPTEAEWERAAIELNMLGHLWQWTASLFAPYPGFKDFPYMGYSATYFDQQHYVLRGGSWATGYLGLRPSFRNWYHPHVRQILAGFRCAI